MSSERKTDVSERRKSGSEALASLLSELSRTGMTREELTSILRRIALEEWLIEGDKINYLAIPKADYKGARTCIHNGFAFHYQEIVAILVLRGFAVRMRFEEYWHHMVSVFSFEHNNSSAEEYATIMATLLKMHRELAKFITFGDVISLVDLVLLTLVSSHSRHNISRADVETIIHSLMIIRGGDADLEKLLKIHQKGLTSLDALKELSRQFPDNADVLFRTYCILQHLHPCVQFPPLDDEDVKSQRDEGDIEEEEEEEKIILCSKDRSPVQFRKSFIGPYFEVLHAELRKETKTAAPSGFGRKNVCRALRRSRRRRISRRKRCDIAITIESASATGLLTEDGMSDVLGLLELMQDVTENRSGKPHPLFDLRISLEHKDIATLVELVVFCQKFQISDTPFRGDIDAVLATNVNWCEIEMLPTLELQPKLERWLHYIILNLGFNRTAEALGKYYASLRK